ncbi:transmembrane protein (Protein of unknown function DUF2359, transmembrane) [Thalictrum thalictroides]|uniref:Transmembrane protein n=1 Tax=Thalictrum thalictroides TaxID=46969 RepID=A0A7J6XE59_THATH|nr:transmembrane protein (Protein of unknown function DUF2359, transmembrane) [Thalictrum thalictroides]
MDEERQISIEEEEKAAINANKSSDHGWQTVIYPKRQKKTSKTSGSNADLRSNSVSNNKSNVFSSVELHADERRRRNLELQRKAAEEAAEEASASRIARSKQRSDDEDESDGDEIVENGKVESKKPKQKKPKRIKVTVAEAASKIDAENLEQFLIEVSESYESQHYIQLMRFADYFARAFSSVKNAEFPWTKMFKDSTVAKLADVPLNDVPEAVYKTSTDWINKRSSDALGSFILWSLDTIFADLANYQGVTKGSKKVVQQGSSKAQVAIFVVLAMALRRKPDVLISLLPKLREDPKYQGQDKLPVILWVIAQASQGDLVVGLYSWVHNLFPVISAKSCNTQSRDLILQLLERILSAPKARSILLNGAVRKGERLVPPSALELLIRTTFPAPSARIKATERFEAAYPTLKELALAGTPGSKAMKQVTQQIFTFAVKAAGDGVPDLSNEAASIGIWCLTQNPDCYKQWEKIYLDNVEASVAVLKKLSEEWKEHSVKHASLDPLRETIKNFRQKNENALSEGEDAGNQATLWAADKYCKVILGRLSRGHGCMKSVLLGVVAVAVGAFVMSPNMEFWDLNKLSVLFSSSESF